MEINFECVHYLTNHNFIRNTSIEAFVLENNFSIEISNHVVYCVGIVDEKRIVHVIKFLGQNNSPGVTSYFIQWYNIACYPLSELGNYEIQNVSFWVHSGVALRKNFFLFQDRMSLVKSSFIYDEKRKNYYRLANLMTYLKPQYLENISSPIYSSPIKISYPMKKNKKQSILSVDKKLVALQKSLKKTLKNCNSFQYVEKTYPRLFHEINNVIN